MDDKRLLELAWIANGDPTIKTGYAGSGFCRVIGYHEELGCECMVQWNPLTDNGDALKLAIDLHIDFYEGNDDGPAAFAGYYVSGSTRNRYSIERHGDDKYAATRRAIVRAAASIGEQMEK